MFFGYLVIDKWITELSMFSPYHLKKLILAFETTENYSFSVRVVLRSTLSSHSKPRYARGFKTIVLKQMYFCHDNYFHLLYSVYRSLMLDLVLILCIHEPKTIQVIVSLAVLTVHRDPSGGALFSTPTDIISSVVQSDVRDLHLHLQLLLLHLVFVSVPQQLPSSPPLHAGGGFVEFTAKKHRVPLRLLLTPQRRLEARGGTCGHRKDQSGLLCTGLWKEHHPYDMEVT